MLGRQSPQAPGRIRRYPRRRVWEALLGCDFILRLDPLFTPARRLQERLDSTDGPIDTDELLSDPVEDSPAVLKTVRLSSEELQRLMEEDAAGGGDAVDHGPIAESDSAWSGGTVGEEDALGEATSFLAGARRAIDSGQVEAARRLLDMAASVS